MPSHSHSSNANGGNNGTGLVSDTDNGTTQTTDNSSNEHNIVNPPIALTINNTGGSQSHNNMQPFFALNYLIKY
jgi:microcystin-dependent protein